MNENTFFCKNGEPMSLSSASEGWGETLEGNKCIDFAEDLLTVMDDFAWNWNLFQAMMFGQLKPVFIPIS